MKLIPVILSLSTFTSNILFAKSNVGDTLYNWNYAGAHLRNKPRLNSPVVKKIPLGAYVIIDSITILTTGIKILDTGRYNKIQLVYSGSWFKVRYDTFTGYINTINFTSSKPDSSLSNLFEYVLHKNKKPDKFDTICEPNTYYYDCVFEPQLLNGYKFKRTSGESINIDLFIPYLEIQEIFAIIKYYNQKLANKNNSTLPGLIYVWKFTKEKLIFDLDGSCHYYLSKFKNGVKVSYYCAC